MNFEKGGKEKNRLQPRKPAKIFSPIFGKRMQLMKQIKKKMRTQKFPRLL